MTFEEFPKIARLSRNCVVTEKLDGSNGQIFIETIPNLGGETLEWPRELQPYVLAEKDGAGMFVGSRNRFLNPSADNFGFAKWAQANADDLFRLGYGRHYGEWWGSGIQRGYGLKEKRFSLFNTARWSDPAIRPACCSVVPVLYGGPFDTATVDRMIAFLREEGSQAVPGFMNPEGVVVWHEAARTLFKKTLDRDEEPKSKSA